jgi:hypothetical protein
MTTPTNYTPPEIRRCYLCGKNMNLPRTADSFLLHVLKNGRSYNYCSYHWWLLRKHERKKARRGEGGESAQEARLELPA